MLEEKGGGVGSEWAELIGEEIREVGRLRSPAGAGQEMLEGRKN